ncbi:hypothetical protein ACEPAH_2324 [Sanghuangporus vaninii]
MTREAGHSATRQSSRSIFFISKVCSRFASFYLLRWACTRTSACTPKQPSRLSPVVIIVASAMSSRFAKQSRMRLLEPLETINTTDAHAKQSGRTIEDAVIRVARESQSIRMRGMFSLVTYDVPQAAQDTPRIKAALASSPAPVRLSVVDEATFLPALLASELSPLR